MVQLTVEQRAFFVLDTVKPGFIVSSYSYTPLSRHVSVGFAFFGDTLYCMHVNAEE